MKQLKIKLAALFAIAVASIPQGYAQDTPIDPAEREKIEQIVQDYLLENPEIIAVAIQELQRKQTLARMGPQIEMYRSYMESGKTSGVLGNPDGDVTIVEFFDYRCGFCRRHFPEVMQLVKSDGNIRYIPLQFPILDKPGQPPVSTLASRAALAAHKQGKFEEFHVAAMTSDGPLVEDTLYTIAARVGLNVAKLKADMNDPLLIKNVQNSVAIGQDIGFSGTPAYIIGDDVVSGARGFDRLLQAVNRARTKSTTTGN